MPWKIVTHDNTPEGQDGPHCVHKENADGSAGEIVSCHETREKALAHQRALYANTSDAGELVRTIDLTEGYDTRPVEFLRTGSFVDGRGRQVDVTPDVLDALVLSFEAGQAGQDIPIDILHKREEAAGWVRSVYRQGDKLLADVEWNTLGRQLVGDRVYRYLSATIDLARFVLRSISLVNFPAVKGLMPLELADNGPDAATETRLDDTVDASASTTETTMEVQNMPNEQTVETPQAPPQTAPVVLTEADLADIRARMEQEVRQAVLAEYAQLKASQERMLSELMANMREERETVEFAQDVTTNGAFALPFTPDEMKELIFAIPTQYRQPIRAAFKRIAETGTVDFTERGTARGTAPQSLDAASVIALRSFLASGGSVDLFFEANPELGAKSTYDLKEFGGNNG